MGMKIHIRADQTLVAQATTGNKQWVAKLVGTHPKYTYEREFIAYQKPYTSTRDRGTASVEDGDIIEKVRYTHSGKNDTRRYARVDGRDLVELDRDDVDAAVAELDDPDRDPSDDDDLPLRTQWGVYDHTDGAMCDCIDRGVEPAPFQIDLGGHHNDGEMACENCGGLI